MDENIYTGFKSEETVFTDGFSQSVVYPLFADQYSASLGDEALISFAGYQYPSYLVLDSTIAANNEEVTALNPLGALFPNNTGMAISASGTAVAVGRSVDEVGPVLYYFNPLGDGLSHKVVTSHYGLDMTGIAISPDGHYAYIASDDYNIWMFNLATGVEITSMPRNTFLAAPGPMNMAVNPVSGKLYSLGQKVATLHPFVMGPFILLEMDDHAGIQREATIADDSGGLGFNTLSVSVSPDGANIAIMDAKNSKLRCYGAGDLTEVWNASFPPGQAVYSLDGKRIYVIKKGGNSLTVVNATDGTTASVHTQAGAVTSSLAVGRRVIKLKHLSVLCDMFGGEMIAQNGADVGVVPSKVEIYYVALPKTTKEKRFTIPGVRNPALFHKNGFRGSLTGLMAQEISSKNWYVYFTQDYGRTWAREHMVWDDSYTYADVCGTADGLELAAGVKKVGHLDSGSMVYVYELWTKYSSDGVTWSTPVKVTGSATNGPISIRQKVECNSSVCVLWQDGSRWESKDLFYTSTKTI